ncbi:MAG: NUDIX hydrolase [Thermodesulfobacteriota bacterium]
MEPTKYGGNNAAYPSHPRVAVGAVVFHQNRVLLIQRANPPSQGKWSIPGGVVLLGETLQEAAEREILEETGLFIKARHPVYTFDVITRDKDGGIDFHYVIVDLLADYVKGSLRPGDDALDARWVLPGELALLDMPEKTRDLLLNLFEPSQPNFNSQPA